MSRKRECPACGQKKFLTRHHVFPKRHWPEMANTNRWSGHPPPPIISICRKCHDKLEKLIPSEIQPFNFYWETTRFFLGLEDVGNVYNLAGLPFWGEPELESSTTSDDGYLTAIQQPQEKVSYARLNKI